MFERDRWIGLRNTVSTCGCDGGATADECNACRDQWTWIDGSETASFHSWYPGEPDFGETFGRIHYEGALAANNDRLSLKYICKSGKLEYKTISISSCLAS